MTEIIKSGLIVEGVEITSEHIGMKLEVVETDSDRYLPVGFETKVLEVHDMSVAFYDTDHNERSGYGVADYEYDDFKFEWVDRSIVEPPKPAQPVKMVGEQKRTAIAKQLRAAWEAKEEADKAYQELLEQATSDKVGLSVTTLGHDEGGNKIDDELRISFDAPTKYY